MLCPVQRGVEDFLTEFAFRGIFYKICAPLLRVSSQAIFGPPRLDQQKATTRAQPTQTNNNQTTQGDQTNRVDCEQTKLIACCDLISLICLVVIEFVLHKERPAEALWRLKAGLTPTKERPMVEANHSLQQTPTAAQASSMNGAIMTLSLRNQRMPSKKTARRGTKANPTTRGF